MNFSMAAQTPASHVAPPGNSLFPGVGPSDLSRLMTAWKAKGSGINKELEKHSFRATINSVSRYALHPQHPLNVGQRAAEEGWTCSTANDVREHANDESLHSVGCLVPTFKVVVRQPRCMCMERSEDVDVSRPVHPLRSQMHLPLKLPLGRRAHSLERIATSPSVTTMANIREVGREDNGAGELVSRSFESGYHVSGCRLAHLAPTLVNEQLSNGWI